SLLLSRKHLRVCTASRLLGFFEGGTGGAAPQPGLCIGRTRQVKLCERGEHDDCCHVEVRYGKRVAQQVGLTSERTIEDLQRRDKTLRGVVSLLCVALPFRQKD